MVSILSLHRPALTMFVGLRRGYTVVCLACLRRQQCKQYGTTAKLLNSRLVEIGKLETPHINEYYKAGQFFLHRVFGYRGVVLFPWMARVFNRDLYGTDKRERPSSWEVGGVSYEKIKGFEPETQPYYQALIDHRDFPFIRTHPEAITFLASPNDPSLYSLPGLDYVSHDDVIPYTSCDQEPFNHELFNQFFAPSGDGEGAPFVSREVLNVWRQKNHAWLELTDVHHETTQGIRVTVMPFYMGHRDIQQSKVHWWRYSIRIENHSGKRVQLRDRHWRIYSVASGTLETVKGTGVIGQEPVFTAEQPAFQYSSHVSLQSPSGHMWGTFRMENSEQQSFEVRVPPFILESHDTQPNK